MYISHCKYEKNIGFKISLYQIILNTYQELI